MKKFAVIGLGNFGFFATKALYEDGNEVIAIDLDKSKVQAIDAYCSEAVVLQATDKEKLKALGLENMDGVIISTGTKISTSILICNYLQEIGVKKILVKAQDEDHGKILKKSRGHGNHPPGTGYGGEGVQEPFPAQCHGFYTFIG